MFDFLEAQDANLEQWTGDDESSTVSEMLEDRNRLLVEEVRTRIQKHKFQFDQDYPVSSPARKEAMVRSAVRQPPTYLLPESGTLRPHDCPACSLQGWLIGSPWERVEWVESFIADAEGGIEDIDYEKTTYRVESFSCEDCGLELSGRTEIAVADLPGVFEEKEEIYPDAEPDWH